MLSFANLQFAQESDQQGQRQINPMSYQPISVTIGGNFIVSGTFTASRLQRLDYFITSIYSEAAQKALGSLNKIETINQVNKEIKKYPLRDITLKRINGDVKKIDLMRFRITGDFLNNPYLQNDDVIIFPENDPERNFIDVIGAVNKEIKFQFVEGDNLLDALLFAGGLNPAYDSVTTAEISRLNSAGDKEEILRVGINSKFPLKRGDRIRVLSDNNQKKDFKILVLGEVNRPGYVHIAKSGTTLREVINKSGGFTAHADLRRSELMNGTDEAQLQKMSGMRTRYEKDSSFTTLPIFQKSMEEVLSEEVLITRSNNLLTEELEASLYLDNALRFIDHKSSVNFENVLEENSEDGNTVVRDGDVIIIPSFQNKVYVFGQVVNPGYFTFQPQKGITYYIEKAGGKTERAVNDDGISLIKGTNRTWIPAGGVKEIESGDMIYVPKNIPKGFDFYLQKVGAFTSIIATVVSLTFLIIQAMK